MKHFTLFGVAMPLVAMSWGQDAPYTTDIISQPYEPLEEYSLVNLSAGWDDPEEMLPIPFDMVMWGDTCTIVMTANLGEMILGVGNANHLVAPVFADICDVSPADTTGQDISEIRYTYDGISPNRIFRVEYHNVGFYDEVYGEDSVITATQRANYQVWLHETGTITFHYGPNTITDHSLIAADFINTAGLLGNFDPDSYAGSLLVAEGAADGPQFQTINDIFDWIYSGDEGWGNTWPSEGTGYVFNPILPVGIGEFDVEDSMTAYPIPAENQLHVLWDGNAPMNADWIDTQGRSVGFERIYPGQTTLNVNDLKAGAYILRMENGITARVVIHHQY